MARASMVHRPQGGTDPGANRSNQCRQAGCLGQARRPPEGAADWVRRCPRGLVSPSLAPQARQALVTPCSRPTGDFVVTGQLAQDFFEDFDAFFALA